jgi:hypothetical protein
MGCPTSRAFEKWESGCPRDRPPNFTGEDAGSRVPHVSRVLREDNGKTEDNPNIPEISGC